MAVIWAIALAKLLFHIYFNNRYGYFRDEFNYLACGDHLQWGYVDQPPLVPFLIHICRALLGDSLRSIRFIPALIVVTGGAGSRVGARTRRPPLCGAAERRLRGHGANVSLQRQSAGHELS